MKSFTLPLLVASLSLMATGIFAQVGINSDGSAPHASAMLDVKATNKGLLVPRMTTAQRTTLAGTATAGLMVFDTDLGKFFYYDGSGWKEGSTGYWWDGNGTNVYLGDLNDNVGIGTTSPARKFEVNGGWRSFRLNTTDSGPFMEFTGSSTTDWSLGTWSNFFWLSTSTDNFTSWTDQFYFTTSVFRPFANNTKSLGESTARWSNLYTVDGNLSGLLTGNTGYFSGDVGIGASSPTRRLEVNSGSAYKTARFTSTNSGSMLEFNANYATDWAIGTWTGTLRILSSSDDLVNLTDEFLISTSEFRAFNNNTKTLGSSGARWSNLYSTDGNFIGALSGNTATFSGLLSGSTATFSGQAAVGTTTLLGAFHVHDGVNQNATLYITPITTGSEDSSRVFLAEDHDASYGMYWLFDGAQNHLELWGKSLSNFYGPHITVQRDNGNVAIGGQAFASGYKLSVNGKIICTEMRVELAANWPDYVFRDDYALMPLDHLRQFIRDNGHLPNVPPADQFEGSGMDVGETQRLMMEKIEELTLYILQQQEQIDELRQELENSGK